MSDYLTRCLWKGVADIEQQQEAADLIEELEGLIKELFVLLERKEETDEGRVFHPTTIQSCRAMDAEKLEQIMRQLKSTLEEKQHGNND